MASQGRNTLCRCGSGRKYKNCHLRHDKEQEALVATAMHEAGHVVATLHYGVSIGEEGVFITDEGNGYTDSNKTGKWGECRIIDLGREIRLAHFVISVIGSVVEFRHRSMTLDTIMPSDIKHWMADFAGAFGRGNQNVARRTPVFGRPKGEWQWSAEWVDPVGVNEDPVRTTS